MADAGDVFESLVDLPLNLALPADPTTDPTSSSAAGVASGAASSPTFLFDTPLPDPATLDPALLALLSTSSGPTAAGATAGVPCAADVNPVAAIGETTSSIDSLDNEGRLPSDVSAVTMAAADHAADAHAVSLIALPAAPCAAPLGLHAATLQPGQLNPPAGAAHAFASVPAPSLAHHQLQQQPQQVGAHVAGQAPAPGLVHLPQQAGLSSSEQQPAVPSASSSARLPPGLPQMLEVKTGQDAVEVCKRAAEDFANKQVNERKRKAGEAVSNDEDEGGEGSASSASKKARPGADNNDADEPVRPEDISHRKYQKRLQKNRNSAFVSRIRRREYTRILEESLASKETEANDYASAYNKVRAEYDNVCAELAALKEAAKSRALEVGRALTRPIGGSAASQGVSNGAAGHTGYGSGASSTAVVTMFMCALMFGIMLPADMHQGANSSGPATAPAGATTSASHGTPGGRPAVSTAAAGTSSATSGGARSSSDASGRSATRTTAAMMPLVVDSANVPLLLQGNSFSGDPIVATVANDASPKVEEVDEPGDKKCMKATIKEEAKKIGGDSATTQANPVVNVKKEELVEAVSAPICSAAAVVAVSSEGHAGDGVPAAETDVAAGVSTPSSGSTVGDAMSEPDSSCPTMVDVDGDLAMDCEPVTRVGLLSQLQKNASALFRDDAEAHAVTRAVERNVADTHSLAVLTKKSAAALDLTSAAADPIVADRDVPAAKKVRLDQTGEQKGADSAVEEATAPGHTFATLLRRLSVVADDRFAAEIGALMAYRLLPSESNSKLHSA